MTDERNFRSQYYEKVKLQIPLALQINYILLWKSCYV